MNWTESPKHEYGSLIASHKHRRQFSIMVKFVGLISKRSGVQSLVKSMIFYKFYFVEFIEFDENYGKTRLSFHLSEYMEVIENATSKGPFTPSHSEWKSQNFL